MEADILSLLPSLSRVPEHSLPLMCAVSGGQPFVEGGYLFFTAADWLMAIAYPVEGEYRHEGFERALAAALEKVPEASSGHVRCWAVGPDLPPRLAPHVVGRDRYFVLDAQAPVPARLRGPLRKAVTLLTVGESTTFTAAHRRLWAEFLSRSERAVRTGLRSLSDNVRELYAATPAALAAGQGALCLLDAKDAQGNLAACLLVDRSQKNFLSYVLGAHSRSHYVPHATDLLFAALLDRARKGGWRYIHLGLGVNEGIERFKRKWGGVPDLPQLMASWEEDAASGRARAQGPSSSSRDLALSLLHAATASDPAFDMTAAQQRPYAMLWEVEKGGRRSWVGGSAHFFCYSFETSLIRLFRKVDNVLFEGPLDEDHLNEVTRHGEEVPQGFVPLLGQLSEEEVRHVERVVRGPEGPVYRWLNMEWEDKADVRRLLSSTRHWYAFFRLWSAYLERCGWRESVDMEAYRTALRMGKNVVPMETIDEQKATLDAVPVARVLRFLRDCGSWHKLAANNRRAYLAGDLEGMMGSSAEFPTRTEQVIGTRDRRFLSRMLPWLEGGRCAVFVGTAHMVNLRHMLADAGFAVRHVPCGVWPKLCMKMRGEREVRW